MTPAPRASYAEAPMIDPVRAARRVRRAVSSRRRRRIVRRADALRARGDLEGARAGYERATDGTDPPGRWLARLADVEARLGHGPEAISHYERALAVEPSQLRWSRALGQLHEAEGDFEQAAAAVGGALDQQPDDPELMAHLGRLLARLERWEEAARHLEEARARAGASREDLIALGECRERLGDRTTALHAWTEALSLPGPNERELWHRVARTHDALEEWAEAAHAYGRALEGLSSDQPELYFQLGRARERAGDHAAAEEAYLHAVSGGDRHARTWYRLARARRKQHDWQGTYEALQRAVDGDGSRANWHYRLGVACEQLGRLEHAAHAYEAAVLRDGSVVEWHEARGRVNSELGRWDLADSAYRAAIDLDDSRAFLHDRLGYISQKRRDWPTAIAAYERALEIEPGNTAWQRRLTAARDKLEIFGPPTYRRPTYLEGIYAYLQGELTERPVYAVGVGAGYVPGSEDDPLIRFLLELEGEPQECVTALLIEPQPARVADLQNLFAGHKSVSILPYAVGGEGSSLTLHQITNEARDGVLAAGHDNDGRRYTSADRDLVVRRLAEEFGFSDEEASQQVEAFVAPTRTLSELLGDAAFPERPDVVQIDVQGLDAQVIRTLDLDRYRPRVISYEIAHLPDDERESVRDHLHTYGYMTRRVSSLDEVAVLIAPDRRD